MHIRQKDDVPVLGCISPCVKTSHSLKTYTIKKKKTVSLVMKNIALIASS